MGVVLVVFVQILMCGLCIGDIQSTERTVSKYGELDLIEFQEATADENGFRIYMKVDKAKFWKNLTMDATIATFNGYEWMSGSKPIVIEDTDGWVDFTSWACNKNMQNITLTFQSANKKNTRLFSIPTDLLFDSEVIHAKVASVYPEDKIAIYTSNSARMHCFQGAHVRFNKDGRHLNESPVTYESGQYVAVLEDAPGGKCDNTQYDLTVRSRFEVELGVAGLRREDNIVSLDLSGKILTANTLDSFSHCTNDVATIQEVTDPQIHTLQANDKKQFDLTKFLQRCKEAVLQVTYQEGKNYTLKIDHLPTKFTVEEPDENTRKVSFDEGDFNGCPATIELQCHEKDLSTYISIQNFTTATFPISGYLDDYKCRIRVWMDKKYLAYASYRIILDPLTTQQMIVIGVVIGVVLLLLLLCACVAGKDKIKKLKVLDPTGK